MDERLRYEQLIGGKLQSLPVPDMQDAIWARIKTQLDLDIPTDDGDDGNTPPSPTAPRIIGWGLSILIIALVTTYFLTKNKPSAKNNSVQPTIIEQTVSPNTQNNSPPLQKQNTIDKTTAPVSTGANNSFNDIGNDSLAQYNPVTNVELTDDSVRTNFPSPSVTLSSLQLPDTSSIIKKKGRGMTGLSDSSYRIVPKKN
ncbi:MAG TPA: hypothetical protein VNT20_20230 [Flavisolibacter sp.]|jgi:hypothetical protein|nr:hypothetical protein [Flavisolibacter sp.]